MPGIAPPIAKSWTEIDALLSNEDVEICWYKPGGPYIETPTADAIRVASRKLGVDFDNTWFSLQMYAGGNECAHCTITVRIRTCGWGTLGRQFGRDLDGLPDIFEGSEREMMSQAIDSIKGRYLIRSTIIDFPFACYDTLLCYVG